MFHRTSHEPQTERVHIPYGLAASRMSVAQRSRQDGDATVPRAKASARVRPSSAHEAEAGFSDSARQRLAKLGLHRPFDLVLHLPLRYEDETRLHALRDAIQGKPVQVEADVVSAEVQYRPRRMLVCQTRCDGETLYLRFFNFYGSQLKQLVPGIRLRLLGEVRPGFFGAEMVHPRYRVVKSDEPLPQSLTPVYPTTAGMAQTQLRRLVQQALASADLSDSLPQEMLRAQRLPAFESSVRTLHHPPPDMVLDALEQRSHPAWRRIKFDELLAQQLSMRMHQERRRRVRAPALRKAERLGEQLLARLPFRLTSAQQRVLAEIRADLRRAHPMQRLLQGDVGSGKTIVAALAALQAIESGYQVAVMAPTEILAEQHHAKFAAWLAPLGVQIAWLAGSSTRKQKTAALERVRLGEVELAVGTHALFQEQVEFQQLGLVIVDEQHRFGVQQRLALRHKGSKGRSASQPHQLMMSATPIPRTLAMSHYADLDVSVIDELPPGRSPVVTKLVADARREEVLQRVADACREGRQAYWVCPLVEETAPQDSSNGSRPRSARQSAALQLQAAVETFERLRQQFPELRVGLVHGRLAGAEKAQVMADFKAGSIQLLVATTVIEVGVDVPNASLMIIEHAERMGLAQLHQLRGRVGRGVASSTCILLYLNPLSQLARERLRVIYENADGFEIARHDLRLRGPGELLGARQSGEPMLRFADLTSDVDLLEAARECALELLHASPEHAAKHLDRWLGGRQDYLRV